MNAADVGEELYAADDDGGEEEGSDGEAADTNKEEVDGAGDALTAAAVGALVEVELVVGAHGRREAGDVEAPAGEDIADDLIGAMRARAAGRRGEGKSVFLHRVSDHSRRFDEG